MNCFQIVSLTYWSQPLLKRVNTLNGCELLSDCIFDILVTTLIKFFPCHFKLWIAFRLYLWHIGHNPRICGAFTRMVVNCFQIVSLTYWSQPPLAIRCRSACCELLSDCIFDILVTTNGSGSIRLNLLWIAFRLYLWHIGHNLLSQGKSPKAVVNCFQIVSLTYWSQQKSLWAQPEPRCELLSDCIFDILVTTPPCPGGQTHRLWIAFRLYLWHIGHNYNGQTWPCTPVVNCFQIVSLTYWSQHLPASPVPLLSCELLSDCIFDILVTTQTCWTRTLEALWIAFRLYLWHIGHNNLIFLNLDIIVVNCFQIVSLTYWSQL